MSQKLDLELRPLWYILSNFVKETCADRDESHGHEHMYKVACNTLIMMPYFELSTMDKMICITCAWLHDVCDHKYDPSDELTDKLKRFLDDIFTNVELTDLIVNIIDRISYSKENKEYVKGVTYDNLDWHTVLVYNGKSYVEIRNIVSDADKLEALGEIGAKRCIQYIVERNYHDVSIEDIDDEACDIIRNLFIEHCDEKLLRLKDDFVHTKAGKLYAKFGHKALEGAIKYVKEHGVRAYLRKN
jgi:HD superfamily phosphodiesterase